MEKSQNFLLKEVIDDLLDTSKSLESSLLKLNYFAMLTKNQLLIDYTNHELQGYSQETELPEYRKVDTQILVDLQIGWNQHPNKELPMEFLDDKVTESVKKMPITEGVGSLERLHSDTKEKDSLYLYKQFPISMLPILQKAALIWFKSDGQISVIAARAAFSKYKIHEILQNVRKRLLSFCMEVGETFGYNIQLDTFKKDQTHNNETVIRIMNTNINNRGDGNVINTGHNSSQNVSIHIEKGDLDGLREKLTNDGIEVDDVKEIEEIVKTEQPDFEHKRLGNKAIGWITKVSGKALAGVGKIATTVSSTVLAEYLKHYYGLH
jgi:hypothetical protein